MEHGCLKIPSLLMFPLPPLPPLPNAMITMQRFVCKVVVSCLDHCHVLHHHLLFLGSGQASAA